jgi:hypothetical protein
MRSTALKFCSFDANVETMSAAGRVSDHPKGG